MDRDWLCEIAAASWEWCMKWEILPTAQRIWMCYVTCCVLRRYTIFISVRAAASKTFKAQSLVHTWCESPIKPMAQPPRCPRAAKHGAHKHLQVSRMWQKAAESRKGTWKNKSTGVSISVRIEARRYWAVQCVCEDAQEGFSPSSAKAAQLSAQVWFEQQRCRGRKAVYVAGWASHTTQRGMY